jgi:hypothetical protein
MNGERVKGAGPMDSTPWPWALPAVRPVLVVCPIPFAAQNAFLVAGEIYRLAHERALAAIRPSRYELAGGVSPN